MADANDEELERAYQAIEAAVAAKGSGRYTLMEEALKLWRLARYARGEVTPMPPSDDPDDDSSAP